MVVRLLEEVFDGRTDLTSDEKYWIWLQHRWSKMSSLFLKEPKGGFRMKHQVADWAERRRKADELYKVLIRGLLDITDNQVDGEIVHPPEVVRHDAVDPYLVVAADKGDGSFVRYSKWFIG